VRRLLLALPPVALAALALAWAAGRAPTVPPVDPDVEGYEAGIAVAETPADAAPFLARHCAKCHGTDEPRGGVALVGPVDGLLLGRAADAVRGGTMPPPARPSPSSAEVEAFLAAVERSAPIPGVTLRRLNRAEYGRTVRDLLGVRVTLGADFPPDDTGEGFDTLGDVLTLSPTLIEKYLAASEAAIDALGADPETWRHMMNPPDDFIPFVLRGSPPLLGNAVKGQRLEGEQEALGRAYLALRSFADRAYRRPVTHAEMARLMRFVEGSPEGIDAGLKLALRAVLVSSHFLFKMEPQGPRTLSDFEVATRLSYFLWSSLPDEELTRAAASGTLREPATLVAQVRRMLRDPKARALAEEFGGQWLQTRALAEATRLDPALRSSLRREAEEFVAHIVGTDRSVLDFLGGEYTFLDARLARHYGIDGVEGDHFRRVSLAGTGRAGVTTLGGVLAVAPGPVKRGKWLLDNVLGAPPPPPPPGSDSLKDAAPGATLRERLERHRRDPACASCHARMDPLGFALEGFDDAGRRREADDRATLPDGRTLRGPAELRAVLGQEPDVFVACLTRKLMVYGLGRSPGTADRKAVRCIVRHAAKNGYRFSSLVIALVRSDAFLTRSPSGGAR
jgi:mono/diheme cytochrome c family protein